MNKETKGEELEFFNFEIAKWYQFWRPTSGLIGGLIFGCVISAPTRAVLSFLVG